MNSILRPGDWPGTVDGLVARQRELARAGPGLWWRPPADRPPSVGGAFVAFPRGHTGAGERGDPAWAAAVVVREGRLAASAVVQGTAGWAYESGLLALRDGPLLDAAVRALPSLPDVLIVNAAGRDHPRRAGLAVHLGAVLDLATIGVTDRALLAGGGEPGESSGSWVGLSIGDEVAAARVRTRSGARAIVVHAGWRTDVETALDVVLRVTGRSRTPEPLRQARRLARESRARVTR